jgi:hypothetical protein
MADVTQKCGAVALVRVFWPGKEPIPMCVDHAEQAKHVADMMGFHLPLQPAGGINACEAVKER